MPNTINTIASGLKYDDEEIWKPVVGYEGRYEVSSHGRIKRLARVRKRPAVGKPNIIPEHILKPGLASNGYLTVNMSQKSVCVQYMVAAAFIGEKPHPKMLVLHWDGVRTNNHKNNLRYGTRLDNIEDAKRHGTKAMGEKMKSSRLTEKAVRRIMMLKGIVAQSDLAEMFGVSPSAIQGVHDGRTWKHVELEIFNG